MMRQAYCSLIMLLLVTLFTLPGRTSGGTPPDTRGTSVSPSVLFGDGRDGDLEVGAGQTKYSDDQRAPLQGSASAGSTSLCVFSPQAGFAAGDELLVIQMQGAGAGSYEFVRVAGFNSCGLTLSGALQKSYSSSNGSAQVVRVPQLNNLTVHSGGMYTAHAWDGSTGGVLAVRASGLVKIIGSLDLSGKGFRGGERTARDGSYHVGLRGEGTEGDRTIRTTLKNGNGGGGGGYSTNYPWDQANGGGGGGNSGNGANGGGTGGGNNSGGGPGEGGASVGTNSLNPMVPGGGGGGGGTDSTAHVGKYGGFGGNGGGIVFIAANELEVMGSIVANGLSGEGGSGTVDYKSGAGGSGAGGTILIRIKQGSLATNKVRAVGGPETYRRSTDVDGRGGAGALGHIRIEHCASYTGSTNPAASSQQISCGYQTFLPLLRAPVGCAALEPVNGESTWGPLDSAVTYYAMLCTPDDTDYYDFATSAAGKISITLTLPPALIGHVSVWLYHENNTVLAGKDKVTTATITLEHTPNTAGSYLVGIYSFDGQTDTSNGYSLRVAYP